MGQHYAASVHCWKVCGTAAVIMHLQGPSDSAYAHCITAAGDGVADVQHVGLYAHCVLECAACVGAAVRAGLYA